MAALVIVEIFRAKGSDRDQPVGAGLAQLDEQAGAGDAGDAALETRADAVGEVMRDQAVDGLALRLHRAPLGQRNMRGDLTEGFRRLAVGQGAFAEPERADQRAVHDEIGIAADRRGEMRVAAQIQAEMTVILGGIFGLRLRAQHDFADQREMVMAFELCQHAVEQSRAQRAALREGDVERLQKFLERVDLLQRRLVMHAVDQRERFLLQHLGRRDVGEDHELLDQLVRVEPVGE